jgi:toxin ParE1/3/4
VIARVEIYSEAEREIADATALLDAHNPALGSDFLHIARAAIKQIQSFPFSAPVAHGTIRKKVLRRFPYIIYYYVEGDVLFVMAVAHQKQAPLYWYGRRSG